MKTALEIGQANAQCALEQEDSVEYENTVYGSKAAYLVNAIDTARQSNVNEEATVQAFMDHISYRTHLPTTPQEVANQLAPRLQEFDGFYWAVFNSQRSDHRLAAKAVERAYGTAEGRRCWEIAEKGIMGIFNGRTVNDPSSLLFIREVAAEADERAATKEGAQAA